MIQLQDVFKKYTTSTGHVVAVDNVSLSIQESEIYGIIGYSGAGKSSLIRLLNGLERPTAGSIQVNGKEVSNLSSKQMRQFRQKVSMIFQHFNLLWSRTVEENIAFPLEIAGVSKEERDTRVKELVALVGLEGREKAYPSQLSGGQKQRVGIARALANRPEVLLCDEATSALDPETTDQILDLLVTINKQLGLTIVLITHEMHVIQKICHRVAVMENGVVVEEGKVIDVFKNPQKAITKRFVSQISDGAHYSDTVDHFLDMYPNGKLIRLTFVGDQTDQPLIARLIKQYELEVTIVQGNITQTQNGALGTLLLHIDGDALSIDEALSFLHAQKVQSEVIHHD
ncbi:methionine ABC transporter ATP-binding protein [Chryseomicrobium palamuruense]|uniref:Methionine ABC transporter ATP-binding protein n=1 Tax=Chryseomicrobium palamuruense TaxID=682973 RepID=A0ABV8UXE2_9BACL